MIQVFGENSRYIELFLARYQHICLTCIVPLFFSIKITVKTVRFSLGGLCSNVIAVTSF